MGTPDFALSSFRRLLEDGHEVVLAVTQSDKPVGRKQLMTAPPVKLLALENGIEVFQPKTLRNAEAIDKISSYKPDMIVVAAYGKILPKEILDLPRYGCVNLHGSVLPKYRGAAPIQHAVLNGERETGITTMMMNEGLDTGDILLCEKTEIGENETAGELFERLSAMCPNILSRTIEKILDGSITRTVQNEAEATLAPMLSKDMSLIDWNRSAEEIHNKIRGLSPWPLAVSEAFGKKIKIYKSSHTDKAAKPTHDAFFFDKTGLYAVCGDGKTLFLEEVQSEGGKRMNSAEFVRGISKL